LDAQLNDVSQQLTEVKVTGSKNKVFGDEQVPKLLLEGKLTSLPTISRSADDFTRLEPSASGVLLVVMINTTVTL
jgi:NADPH-dependent ferric siderophore reductase